MDAPLHALESPEPPQARSMQRMGMRTSDNSGASDAEKAGSGRSGGTSKPNAQRYRCIVADPPWQYAEGWPAWNDDGQRKPMDYAQMTLDEIKAMPVRSLMENEAYLFLWTTNRYLEEGFKVCRAWDCVPRQVLTWCKPAHGKGPGGMFATTTEFVIIGQRIGPKSHARGQRTNGERVDTSWFQWPRYKHSEKPEAFIDMVERVCPGPYLELFARRQRLGWHTWGNQSFCHTSLGGGGAEQAGDDDGESQSRASSHTA